MRPNAALVGPLGVTGGLLLAWTGLSAATRLPPYLLPNPWEVACAGWRVRATLVNGAGVTLIETLLGLLIGIALGAVCALGMSASARLQRWLMPLLLVSQAMPVFALAPLLVLWFGFGLASKVVMAVLVIFFPVVAALLDGLRRTPPGHLDLARTMGAGRGRVLLHLRLPAALPFFAAGVRVAAAIAPIGAVIGEWVGASQGLGYVMLNANRGTRTDVMFAGLLVLAVMTIGLWSAVDRLLRRLVFWAPT